jgi:hypothetical protein
MKKHKVFVASLITVMLQAIALQDARAQTNTNQISLQTNQLIFPALLSATCVMTNESGGLTYQSFGNRDLISDCARDEGITNFTGLSLVFNLNSNALAVVARTNVTSVGTNHVLLGTNLYFICAPLRFTNIVWLSDTNTNKVELLASVFSETNSAPSGTLAATERFQYGQSNRVSGFSLIGRIQYAVPANGTNGAAIYRGVLVAGNVVNKEEEEEGENEEGNHGNHGNGNNGDHGNGDNGLHLGQIKHGKGPHGR